MAELVFWLSSFFILYTYAGYPITLWLLRGVVTRPVKKSYLANPPSVSVLIAVKDEERNVAARLINIIDQDYPSDSMEIIVVSDGSTDKTGFIVKELAREFERGKLGKIRFIELENGRGKPAALNMGAGRAEGEILVFADARQKFSRRAISELVANFSDPEVGCVSGELLFVQDGKSNLEVEMGVYWRYEKLIRKLESYTGSVVGATGAIYAIRRELFREIPAKTLLDDVLIPLLVSMQGYRVLFEASALAFDTVSKNMGKEWDRKVRTLSGNWQLLSLNAHIINPFRNRYVWRFFWHKLARLLVPFLLLVLLASSLVADGMVYMVLAYLQALFYLLAFCSIFLESFQNNPVTRLCYFFCMMNVAAAYAMYIWISGRCGTIWKR